MNQSFYEQLRRWGFRPINPDGQVTEKNPPEENTEEQKKDDDIVKAAIDALFDKRG
jgi:hypothetical protein